MRRYIIRRLLVMIPIILCVAILVYTIMFFTPGDPALMPPRRSWTPCGIIWGWISPISSSWDSF